MKRPFQPSHYHNIIEEKHIKKKLNIKKMTIKDKYPHSLVERVV